VAVATTPGEFGAVVSGGAVGVGVDLGVDLLVQLQRADAKGVAGEVVSLPLFTGRTEILHLVGTGDGSPAALRKAGAALVRRTASVTTLRAALTQEADAAGLEGLIEGLLLAAYRFRLGHDDSPPELADIELLVDDPAALEPVRRRATVVVAATLLARDLVNTPSLEKSPGWLADQARQVTEPAGCSVRVRNERELAAEGFGGVLGVGMGSTRPPRLIEMCYDPPGARQHVVLVGKGITFDSGGLSIKTSEGMVAMKSDMAGGGAVIAAMSALQELGVPVKVTGLVPAAENMPSGSALRPGDVITQYGGKTVEVLNTDAEGRLVLADALAYADAVLDPDAVVDLATLTGAISVGLGRRDAGLYSTDEELAGELLAAAEAAGERLWRMPLVEDYRDTLDSPVADLANIGHKTYSGGSIVAALFLREFAGSRRWAHLDIAGAARADADEHEVTKGGTGFGVRLLLCWLAGLEREQRSGPGPAQRSSDS
jgi:leucyl aminopeptidase